MKKIILIILSLSLLVPSVTPAQDILDPDFYGKDETIKSYIKDIRDGVKEGVRYADEFKEDLGSIKADQLKVSERSLTNTYEIKLLSLEQGVIKKRVELLEVQGQETRKLLTLLSEGVEKSLRFVNGVYGVFGLFAGVLGTVTGGLTIAYIKKKLRNKKRLDND